MARGGTWLEGWFSEKLDDGEQVVGVDHGIQMQNECRPIDSAINKN